MFPPQLIIAVIQQLLDWLMILVGNAAGMGYGPGPEMGRYNYGFRGSPMPVCLHYNPTKLVILASFSWAYLQLCFMYAIGF